MIATLSARRAAAGAAVLLLLGILAIDLAAAAAAGQIFRFEDVREKLGLEKHLRRWEYGHGAAWGDVDGEGRLDVFMCKWFAETPAARFHNITAGGHWLAVKVTGRGTLNPMGIGAVVRVYRSGMAGQSNGLLGRADITVGTGYASGYGLARDEANQPLKALDGVLGLEARQNPKMYYTVRPYGATDLERYDDARSQIAPVPDGTASLAPLVIQGTAGFAGTFKPVIGREVLKPARQAQVLAKFADGSPAVTCNGYGKGKAYVVGFFPGLEYSAGVRSRDFDMSRGFDAGNRSYVAAPALSLVRPVVEPAQPTVEAVLLENKTSGMQAVTVMNWAYRAFGAQNARGKSLVQIVPQENLVITIRGAGEVKKVTSGMLGLPLDIVRSGDGVAVILPRLDEGDVLLG